MITDEQILKLAGEIGDSYELKLVEFARELIALAQQEPAQAVPVDSDTRKVVEASIKVKLGNEYGDDIAGLWFWLLPADEYAEQAIIKRLEAGE